MRSKKLEACGANSFMHLVPGAAHSKELTVSPVKRFFKQCLQHEELKDQILGAGDSVVLKANEGFSDSIISHSAVDQLS